MKNSMCRYGRVVAVIAVFVMLALYSLACGEVSIGGACSVTADCHTWYNYYGGAVCWLDRCTCPSPNDSLCCPDGGTVCEWNEYECRSHLICEGGLVADASSSSSSSSGEPITSVPPGGACTSDAQCPKPKDYRCGAALCKNGSCAFEIPVGEPIKSQYPGDCKLTVCTFTGDVIQPSDFGDPPLDGNPCTSDFCDGETTLNVAYPDGTPCPGGGGGICVLGKCQECSQPLNAGICKPSEFCDWDRCAPLSCNDNQTDSLETDLDCGGPDCVPCPTNYGCIKDADCISGVCKDNVCQMGTGNDNVKNNLETGVDCGSPETPPNQCEDGEGCRGPSACVSGVCYVGVCQPPTCFDDRINGDEAGTDCGTTCPLLCP